MALARCAISRALFAMALSVLADSLALGAQSTRRTCCSVVWVHPARYRVFVAVIRSRARRMPETLMRLRRKWSRSWRPASSSPTTPTGRTRAPRSARLKTALAAPPGYDSVRRWRRIRTGASRETREISPETNSSRTKSPTTPMIWREKPATMSRRRVRSTLASDVASDLRGAPEDDLAGRKCLRCLRVLLNQAPCWLRVSLCAPLETYHSDVWCGNWTRACVFIITSAALVAQRPDAQQLWRVRCARNHRRCLFAWR